MRALLAAIAVTLAAAPAAQAGWSNAHGVRGAGTVRTVPALASNQRGDVLVAWIEKRGVMVATAQRGGRLSRAHRVPGKLAAARAPAAIEAAIDETGMAAVAWSDCRPIEPVPSPACGLEVRAAVSLPGGGFAKARRISDVGKIASLGEVAVRAGQAVVTYGQRKRGTRSATFVAHSSGGGFKRQRIARFSRAPDVVRARDGSERLFYSTDTGVRAVTRAASGHFGRPREVIQPGLRFFMAEGGASGQQALIWKTGDTGALREGVILPGRPIASRTLDPGPGGSYAMAVDGAANGQFVTLFENHRKLQGLRYSRRVPGSARFAASRDVPRAGGGRAPDVSIRPDGAAAFAWSEGGGAAVRVGVLGLDGRMRATRSFAAGSIDTAVPKTSIDRHGRVWLVWLAVDRLRVARYAR